MLVVGLTGSIGMGKSTTANMFRDAGIPVYDADQSVHNLYQGKLVEPIREIFPDAIKNGVVDRQSLAKKVLDDDHAMEKLEQIVHPAVRKLEEEFIKGAEDQNQPFVILDIPLLFESRGKSLIDQIIVVSADADIQKKRVLARKGMDEKKFNAILARQLPDVEKRKRADFLIDTGKGLDHARKEVAKIIEILSKT